MWDHRPRGRGRYKIANNLVAQSSPPAMDRCVEAGTSSSCRILPEAQPYAAGTGRSVDCGEPPPSGPRH